MMEEAAHGQHTETPPTRFQGAYIDGPVVVHHNTDPTESEHNGGAKEISIPARSGSDKSSSIVLSSLHSSEISHISYSVYSDDINNEESDSKADIQSSAQRSAQSSVLKSAQSSEKDLEIGGERSSGNGNDNSISSSESASMESGSMSTSDGVASIV